MNLLLSGNKSKNKACIAQVSYSEEDDFGAVWDRERRGMPVFSPRGINYRPCEGDNILLMPVENSDVCVGVLCNSAGLASGELSLSSSGGANIHLKNDGSIVLNGLVITRDGKLQAPQ